MITVEQRGDLVALVVDGGDRVLLLDIPDAQQLVIDLYATLPNVTHEVAEALLDAQLDIADITSGRTCLLGCHQPVEDGDGKVNEVRGFVKPGKSATVLLRKPTGRVAHERCAEGAKRGGTGQQSAF